MSKNLKSEHKMSYLILFFYEISVIREWRPILCRARSSGRAPSKSSSSRTSKNACRPGQLYKPLIPNYQNTAKVKPYLYDILQPHSPKHCLTPQAPIILTFIYCTLFRYRYIIFFYFANFLLIPLENVMFLNSLFVLIKLEL
jgi:hypothetical protein